MAHYSHIDPVLEVALIKLSGYVDAEEIVEVANAIYQAPDWQPHYGSLWDFRPTHEVDITPAGLDMILKEKQAREAEGLLQGKIAGVIDRSAVMFFGQLVEIRAGTEVSPVKAFQLEREARTWLGLPEEADLWQWLHDNSHM